jgi:PfaB family protein
MEKAFATGKDWDSQQGSYFTANPLGGKGKVAFVYPGGFTSYIGLGRDVFQLFPEMYEQVSKHTSRLGQMIGERPLYPRSMKKLSKEQLKSLSAGLIDTPIVMFESGIIFAILFTNIMRDRFHIEPQLALGYSMGEISMFYALGVWDKTDKMSNALKTTPAFQTRLAGPMDTVRDAWNLPKAGHKNEKIWHCYTLKTPVSNARQALENESRAYLIIINTPNEIVIAGEEQACRRVIQRLNCEHFAVPISDVIHCEIVRPDYDALASLHRLSVNDVSGIDFYSAVNYAPIRIDIEGIANNIANLYCSQIDFPKLIQQAYKGGARIFVELGPRESCTKWIGEILGKEKHLAVGINRKGVDDKICIIRALARLFSHRVPLDLSPLYSRSEIRVSPGRELIKSISPGGVRIESAILTEENKKRFRSLPTPPALKALPEPPNLELPPTELQKNGQGIRELSNLDLIPPEFQGFDQNLSLISSAHSAFLQARREGLQQIGEMIQLQTKVAAQAVLSPSGLPKMLETAVSSFPAALPERPARSPEVIWGEADLLEFAGGKIADVFGEEYSIIDSYRRRVRLPIEPYLLVSRVTRLDAERGVFRPSSLTTEYDIPHNAWFSVDGQIPWAVAVESGQCDLLLISYLGIDFECKGDRVYRLLDCTLTFLEELPKEGETLRYDIKINSFARSGGNLLFFFSYECFVKDKMVLKMDGGCAGFFSDKELESGKGIVPSESELEERSNIQKQHFDPLLTCDRSTFEKTDLLEIIQGNVGACFGAHYDRRGLNPSLRFAAEEMLMLDRVVSIDPKGGAWGLGSIVAEKILAPDHWYFPCHFKGDQVMAGSLMAEGCGQLLQFYLLFLGLQTCTRDARFQPIPNLPQRVRCRGQVTPKDSLLTYRMEIKEIGIDPKPYAIADVDIILGDNVAVDFKDLGVELSEKSPEEPLPKIRLPEKPEFRPQEALFTQYHLEEFATGSIAKCFGPEFEIYENRQPPRTPNGDLQLISRVLEVTGKRHELKKSASVVTEYDVPPDAWFFQHNSHPAVMPYSILMEISLQPCGFISAYMGTTLMFPDIDFYFRNLDGEGNLLRVIDLRGKTITNRSELLSTVATENTILQQFRFELSHDGLPFYKGSAAFGYFISEALTHQLGLDGGINNHPLHEKRYLSDTSVSKIDLRSATVREQFYQIKPERPYYRLAGDQLDFLDEVQIAAQGGKHQQGYIYACKKIDPSDWFFPCHFYQDPVMPGSLGIESILEAMQVFALQQNLGAHLKSPHFTHLLDRSIWKYRGQIIPDDDQMALEIHIKKVENTPERVTVLGDASLWKNNIRIYEVKDSAICLAES